MALVPEDRATPGHHPRAFGRHQHDARRSSTAHHRAPASSTAAKVRSVTDEQIKRLSVKTASRDHAVSTLSGGNQQKVVIGKWLATDPDILVLDEPTAGIDIGSKSEIIRLVRDLAGQGKGIVVISSELSELLAACDRIVVMADGRVHADMPRDGPRRSDDARNTTPPTACRRPSASCKIEIQEALRRARRYP